MKKMNVLINVRKMIITNMNLKNDVINNVQKLQFKWKIILYDWWLFFKPICIEENTFEYIFTQEWVKNCPLKDIKQNTCIQNYKNNKTDESKNEEKEEDTKAQDIMLQNIEVGFTSEDYDSSNFENGEDDIFEDEKLTVTLTTTKNQKNNTNNNITIIDLGECEGLFRKEYNISENG